MGRKPRSAVLGQGMGTWLGCHDIAQQNDDGGEEDDDDDCNEDCSFLHQRCECFDVVIISCQGLLL